MIVEMGSIEGPLPSGTSQLQKSQLHGEIFRNEFLPSWNSDATPLQDGRPRHRRVHGGSIKKGNYTKKRRRSVEKWKDVKPKKLRDAGRSYTTRRGEET